MLNKLSTEEKNKYPRKIVALANNENFDEMLEGTDFAEIYDLALRYLDKKLASEKEANWERLVELANK